MRREAVDASARAQVERRGPRGGGELGARRRGAVEHVRRAAHVLAGLGLRARPRPRAPQPARRLLHGGSRPRPTRGEPARDATSHLLLHICVIE